MSLYEEKNSYLNSEFKSVESSVFYRELFPVNSFENEVGKKEIYEKTNKGNGFIVYQTENQEFKTRLIFDDLAEIEKYKNTPSAFLSPISYFGRNRTSANARELFALTFDLDQVGREEIGLLFSGWIIAKRIPRPTYIVNSGGGLHLYYVFENPIPLYPNIQKQLKKLKYELTEKIWNGDTSQNKTKQFQGINQGFRIVGGLTKTGEEVLAFRVGKKVTLEYLSQFVSAENQITDTFYHSKITLEQAKKKYPEWYEQRIVQGRQKENWTCKRALYDWWKNKAPLAEVHHRYFYIMCLTIYAIKCGIDFDELKKDAYELQPILSNYGKKENNPFTKDDVKSALEMYQECYRSFPRQEISVISGIKIEPNKRNGRKQNQHLKIARFTRDLHQEELGTKWNGRKSAKDAVLKFLECNPRATYKEFEELTGMKKDTYYKYKKLFKNS